MKNFSRLLYIILIISGCTPAIELKDEVIGRWIYADVSVLEFDKNYHLYGKDLNKNFFPALKQIKSSKFSFSGTWEIFRDDDDIIRITLDKSLSTILAYGCPIFIKRKGILEDGEIEYLYLILDVETGIPSKFFKQKSN